VLKPLAVPGNGDCLFFSVAHMLLDWLDRESGHPAQPPTPEELAEVARYLRGRVAIRVLDPNDAGCNNALLVWWRLWKEACRERESEMMVEMRHMKGVSGPEPSAEGHGDESGSFMLADRRILFRNMMDPAVYWGDEFALRTMEAVLGCRLCVVNEQYMIIKRETGQNEQYSPKAALPSGALPVSSAPFLGMLLLSHSHYEPLAGPNGELAWKMDELPDPLNRLVDRWLGDAE
jgi:hypothetical protein